MLKKLFLLILLFVVSGCTKKPQQLDVQVFVVTKGGENIKLGLVEVKAMPLEKVLDALRPVAAERDAALTKLKNEEEALEQEFSERKKQYERDLDASYSLEKTVMDAMLENIAQFNQISGAAGLAAETYCDEVERKVMAIPYDPNDFLRLERIKKFKQELASGVIRAGFGRTSLSWGDFSSKLDFEVSSERDLDRINTIVKIVSGEVWNGIPEQKSSVLNAAQRLQAAVRQARDATAKKYSMKAPQADFRKNVLQQGKLLILSEKFAVALPSAVMSAKTDADGRCSLMLQLNQRWVISAVGERQAGSEREHYVWIVEVPQKEGASNTLLLSNDNLLEDGANPLGLK